MRSPLNARSRWRAPWRDPSPDARRFPRLARPRPAHDRRRCGFRAAGDPRSRTCGQFLLAGRHICAERIQLEPGPVALGLERAFRHGGVFGFVDVLHGEGRRGVLPRPGLHDEGSLLLRGHGVGRFDLTLDIPLAGGRPVSRPARGRLCVRHGFQGFLLKVSPISSGGTPSGPGRVRADLPISSVFLREIRPSRRPAGRASLASRPGLCWSSPTIRPAAALHPQRGGRIRHRPVRPRRARGRRRCGFPEEAGLQPRTSR